ncbi:MAG: hypothetical protein R6X18_00875 [Chloroflexota bacterium]
MKGLVFRRSQFGKASADQQPEWLVDLLVIGTMALLLAMVILVARFINIDNPAGQMSPASGEPVGLFATGQSLPAVKALPPMGTSYLSQPDVLQALAAESAVATGLAISPVTEAEHFNREWYEAHTKQFHALLIRPALNTNQAIYTDRYWEMAKNRTNGTSTAGEYAIYTDRYWRMGEEEDRMEPFTPGRTNNSRQNRTEWR